MHHSTLVPRFSSKFRLFALACLCVGLLQVPAIAQDEAEEEEAPPELMKKPIATVAVASVERLKTDIKHIFETVDRMDVYEAMEGAMSNVGDLKGMDQTKPFGVMVYLRAGFPPTPEVIGYVPVNDITDLTKTIELGPVLTKKLDENRYEIIGERGEVQVRLQHGFAFITTNGDLLENGFADPARITRGITSKYDIAASLNMDSIPRGMRDLFMNFVKAQANSEMQQRDDEPDGVYKMRRASSENTMRGLTQVMNELEKLTIGIDADPDTSSMAIEIVLDAQEGSKLAKSMRRISSKRSVFDPIVAEDAPMSVSVSFPIEDRDKDNTKVMLEGMQETLVADMTKDSAGEAPPGVAGLFKALRDTTDAGHTNMFLQFYGEPKGFMIVGGLKVLDGRRIGVGLKEILEHYQSDINSEVGEIEFDIDKHLEVPFHYICLLYTSPSPRD